MAPKVYGLPMSPPFRAVLLTAKAIGLDVEIVNMDLLNEKDHLKPEFIKKNPQHTVPMLEEDDGHTMWESHAIVAYLVGKYSPNDDSLYPKDLRKRAVVDQRLHFDTEKLFTQLRMIGFPIFMKNEKTINPANVEYVHEAYEFLDKFATNAKWIAGDHLTIADFCIACTLGNLTLFVPLDAKKYPHAWNWWENVRKWSFYEEICKEAEEQLQSFIIPHLRSLGLSD